jgi:hypothetical protein
MVNLNLKRASQLLLISMITISTVSAVGCRKATAPVAAKPSAEPLPSDPGTGPNGEVPTELPQGDSPTDTPEPLPAPTQPVNPGQPIIAKAIAKTTAYRLPIGNINGVYVNVELTWQPVNGAKEYWLFKGNLPTKEQVTKGGAYKIIKADGVLSTYFLDGAIPPSFAGGNLWDKVKKGFGAYTLKPGTEYKYKVFATDMEGNVVGESDAAVTIPLPPIAAPINIKISETNNVTPLFEWESTDGVPADGYFISVMPPIAFGKQPIPNTNIGYAFWSTFRNEKTKVARYGASSDNSVAYPGSLPFNVTTPLKMAGRYSVSITAIKTDTNDMRTAKAVSKAWSESKLFSLGTIQQPANPVAGTPNTSNPSDPNAPATTPAPAPTPAPAEGLLDKLKRWTGF